MTWTMFWIEVVVLGLICLVLYREEIQDFIKNLLTSTPE